ncbi:glycosyltransferase family 4 protein [Candidatus Woesearchaeota archaeon]|nr:glycosyltransferase family 4 protein [Candidatus Woesearchaeota archaeon]
MRVLLLTEYFPDSPNAEITGGVESRAFNIASRMAKKHDVTVLTSWREGLSRKSKFGKLKVLREGPHHGYSNYAGFISRIEFAIAAIKKGSKLRADIVDGYNWTTYLPAYFIGRAIKKPIVATYHETWTGEWIKNKGIVTGLPYEIYERILLRLNYDLVMPVSEFTRKRLAERGIDESKMTVVNNGVDIKKLDSVKGKGAGVCYVGRLVKTKNVDVLIKAMSLVNKKYPDVRCRIIGQGPEMNRLKMMARDFGANVDFMGFMEKYEDVMKTVKSSSILCHPGTVEGFGMILLEAMALDIPYVCSDIEVFREITDNGNGGFLFKQIDHKDLAKKIIMLIKDKKLYSKKKAELKKTVRRYDWDPIVEKVEKAYLSLINEKKK